MCSLSPTGGPSHLDPQRLWPAAFPPRSALVVQHGTVEDGAVSFPRASANVQSSLSKPPMVTAAVKVGWLVGPCGAVPRRPLG